MIVWLNGTHGAGKTTTSALLQPMLPDARALDAEKVGEVLMDITPGLPATDNFQHWEPWRPLVVETARRVLEFTGGTLVMPMTVLVESYWREISDGLTKHGIPIRHFCSTPTKRLCANAYRTTKFSAPQRFASRIWNHTLTQPAPGCTMKQRSSTPPTSHRDKPHSRSQLRCLAAEKAKRPGL